jgi:hypothetical protein
MHARRASFVLCGLAAARASCAAPAPHVQPENAYLRLGQLAQARADFRHGGNDPLGLLAGVCLTALTLVALGLAALTVRRAVRRQR